MNRFIKEYAAVSRKYRSMYFAAVICIFLALCVSMYGRNIEKTYTEAFNYEHDTEQVYSFIIEGDDNEESDTNVTGAMIKEAIAINKALSSAEGIEYGEYLCTTGHTSTRIPDELMVNLDEISAGADTSYEFNLIMMDEEFAKKTGIYDEISSLFEKSDSYPETGAAYMGAEWTENGFTLPIDSRSISFKSGIGDYNLILKGVLPKGIEIEIAGTKVNLDSYIIIPLQDVNPDRYPTIETTRKMWYSVYKIKNRGILFSNLGVNEVQRELNREMEKEGISREIKVEGAESTNKLIFNDDAEELYKSSIKLGNIMAVAGIMILFVSCVLNFLSNRKYFYLAYLYGTGKTELLLAAILQYVFFIIIEAVTSCMAAIGMSILFKTSAASLGYVICPVVFTGAVCMLIYTIQMVFWDAGKTARNYR